MVFGPGQDVQQTYAIDTEWPYTDPPESGEDTTEIGKILEADSNDRGSTTQRIQSEYNVDFEGDQRGTAFVASVINWFLAISGLVALVILVIGFYKIFIAKDSEEALKDARKTVVSAVIALLVIGAAWFIVSQFFDVFFRVKGDTTG